MSPHAHLDPASGNAEKRQREKDNAEEPGENNMSRSAGEMLTGSDGPLSERALEDWEDWLGLDEMTGLEGHLRWLPTHHGVHTLNGARFNRSTRWSTSTSAVALARSRSSSRLPSIRAMRW